MTAHHGGSIRWGVIGIGRFGRLHARAIRSVHGIELAALCNRNSERLTSAAAELGVARSYADYRELLADESIQAVSITTHWRQHAEVAQAALAAGKHVLLEKPMAATSDECWQIVEAARRSRGKLLVGHLCRFDPRITLAKEAIQAGRIGRIVSMHAKRNLPTAPGALRLDKISPLMGDGVHDADLMLWLWGDVPTRIYGRQVRVRAYEYPDVGWALLEFGDAALGVIETNWGLPANVPTVIDAKLEIVGSEGMLTIDCAHTGLTVLDSNGLKMQDTDYWPDLHGTLVGALRDEIAYFADCIRCDRTPVVITPVEAARAVCVMEAAERSAELGQPVEFRDPFATA